MNYTNAISCFNQHKEITEPDAVGHIFVVVLGCHGGCNDGYFCSKLRATLEKQVNLDALILNQADRVYARKMQK